MNIKAISPRAVADRLAALLLVPIFAVCRVFTNFLALCLSMLASACFNESQYAYAELAYKLILLLQPSNRRTLAKLISLYIFISNEEYAIELLCRVLEHQPDHLHSHVLLAGLYTREREFEKAKKHLDIAYKLSPDTPDVFAAFGVFYRFSGNLSESSRYFTQALKDRDSQNTSLIEPLNFLAQNLLEENNKEEAIKLLEEAIRLAPDHPLAYHELANIKYIKDASHPYVANIEKLLKDSRVDLWRRLAFHYVLGEVFDCAGQWNEAFAHFEAANELSKRRHNFDVTQYKTYVDERIAEFSIDKINRLRVGESQELGRSLIFILGMPRSGTTLAEQILASHPGVCAGGERRDIDKIVRGLGSELGGTYPFCIESLDRTTIDRLAFSHLEHVKTFTGSDVFFVDKALSNFLEIGLINLLFPGAKIIYCRRDPLDNCLSCYFKNLTQIQYSYDLQAIAYVYKEHVRMMKYWQSLLPGRILDLQYESVVHNPETEIRRLLAFCGLSWDPACLNHQDTRRVVLTASASQVKRPIYTNSVKRWENYRDHIEPLIKAFE